jgi:hypothetical protein
MTRIERIHADEPKKKGLPPILGSLLSAQIRPIRVIRVLLLLPPALFQNR